MPHRTIGRGISARALLLSLPIALAITTATAWAVDSPPSSGSSGSGSSGSSNSTLSSGSSGANGSSGGSRSGSGSSSSSGGITPPPSKKLQRSDLAPINNFLTLDDLSIDKAETSAQQTRIQADPNAARSGGSVPIGTSIGTPSTQNPTSAAPAGGRAANNDSAPTYVSGGGAPAADGVVRFPGAGGGGAGSVTRSDNGQNSDSSTNIFNPSSKSSDAQGGATSTATNSNTGTGYTNSGTDLFKVRKELASGDSVKLGKLLEGSSREDLEKSGLAKELDLFYQKEPTKLPDQFKAGSYFATRAGAGPMPAKSGTSIQVGTETYEYRKGMFVWIAGKKHGKSLRKLASLGPTATAQLPPLTELHANLGPVPLDKYDQTNGTTLATCKPEWTVKKCVRAVLADKSKQKVKGLRFMFGLAGGGSSTAILEDGKLNPVWQKNLQTFLKDIRTAGITEIAPTPVFGGWAGDRSQEIEVKNECNRKTEKYKFYAAMPWATQVDDLLPHGGGSPKAYECSPANPIFVGWKAIHAAMETLIKSAKEAKLGIYELDLYNEINVDWYTVQARLIYDNKHTASGDPDFLQTMRVQMKENGFDPMRVTYSVAEFAPRESGYDCLSSYGDSARVASLSGLLDAIAGNPFGAAKDVTVEKGLLCLGNPSEKISLPIRHALPQVIDVHSYSMGTPAVLKVETALWANAVDAVMKKRAISNPTFILGETHSNTQGPSGRSCEGATPETAVEFAKAFSETKLAARQSVFRPWYNQASSCYAIEQKLSPPLIPAGPSVKVGQLANP